MHVKIARRLRQSRSVGQDSLGGESLQLPLLSLSPVMAGSPRFSAPYTMKLKKTGMLLLQRRRAESSCLPHRLAEPPRNPSQSPRLPLLFGWFFPLQGAVCTGLAAGVCRCKIRYSRALPSQRCSPGRLSSPTTVVV